MQLRPHDINNSMHGFVYPSMNYFRTLGTKATWCEFNSPLQGEYGYYKSANLTGVSANVVDGYEWYYTNRSGCADRILYDRTYHTSGGTKYGYFMHTNASDESRPLVTVDFIANLCAGSALIFTAWIADMAPEDRIKPQVMFKLYGVDGSNNATLLQSMMSDIGEDKADLRKFYANILLQARDMNVQYERY